MIVTTHEAARLSITISRLILSHEVSHEACEDSLMVYNYFENLAISRLDLLTPYLSQELFTLCRFRSWCSPVSGGIPCSVIRCYCYCGVYIGSRVYERIHQRPFVYNRLREVCERTVQGNGREKEEDNSKPYSAARRVSSETLKKTSEDV